MYYPIDLEKFRHDQPDIKTKVPFEHQKEAFEKLSSIFTFKDEISKAGILVLPTGAGKTFTSVNWLCRNVLTKNIKILWLANTSHLLTQAFDSFAENAFESFPQRKFVNIRVVSSDPLHCKASDIQLTDDVIIITTQTAISNFETEALDGYGKKRKTAFKKFLEHSSQTRLFIVLDEAHHAPAFGCRNLLIGGSKISRGLKQLSPNYYLLGLTATPTYTDERRRGWLWEIFKDKIIFDVDKTQLVKRNILAVPEYIQKDTGEEFEIDDVSYNIILREHKDLPDFIVEELASRSGRNEYIVNEYLLNHKTYKKTIIFADRWYQCVSLKEKMLQKANEMGIVLKVDAIYSHIDANAGTATKRNQRTSTENSEILRNFKANKLDVLINVKMLSEGTDVPDVNTVFITRQTTSSILLTQMIGRALRGKKAGGGSEKEIANIVFFVDKWKRAINFANPEGKGEKLEDQPKIRGRYPLELVSLKLVEQLARKIDSGIVFSDKPFLELLPLGWYEVEILSTVDGETNLFKEFVVVFENTKQAFIKFIAELEKNIDPEWENDILDESYVQNVVSQWIEKYFHNVEDFSGTLDLDLANIGRHIAQTKKRPPFYSFEERNKHDLTKIAEELIEFNEFIVQERLISIYNNPDFLWQTFYKSYDRFKTAFDAERNQVFHFKKYGSLPVFKPEPIKNNIQNQRELTEAEKERVFIRDNFTCLCCGKTKAPGRKVRFEVDHIVPYTFGGVTNMENSQTLCKICNKEKGINELNFRIYKTPLSAPKSEIKLFDLSNAESFDEILRRIVNIFYHCHAVSTIKLDTRQRRKYRYEWEIHLNEGNDPEWLKPHLEKLKHFIKNELKYPILQELRIF